MEASGEGLCKEDSLMKDYLKMVSQANEDGLEEKDEGV